MEEEQWVEHPIYTDYIISSEGRVYNCKKNKILKGAVQNGNIRYLLYWKKKGKNISSDNLVLDTFGQNDFNKKDIFLKNLPEQSEEMIEVEINGQKILVPIWKKIVDFPLYRIGYDGEIYSCTGSFGRPQIIWKKLNPSVNNTTGYRQTSFFKDKKEYKIYVHKLVLEAYVSKRPKNLQCCHKDGNKLNNHISNLRWDTPYANIQDRYLHNTVLFGEDHPRSVLTEEKVLKIHDLKSQGLNSQEISKILDVKERTVSTIIQGGNWKWLHPILGSQVKNKILTKTV